MRGRGHNAIERLLPLGYLGVALLLLVGLFPTKLRPPAPPPPTSAELDPDAPPDPEAILSELRRGTSGTAGAGIGPGGGGPFEPPTPPPVAARACPFGFGNPARQTSSIYSAPCAPRFTGDNGGATWKGVTANEVRVAVGSPTGQMGTEGPVPDAPRPDENANDRTWRVLQQWLNTRYQLWGRRLQLVVVTGAEDPTAQRAAAGKADTYKVFAAVLGRGPSQDELAQRQIVSFGEKLDHYSARFHVERRPYAYTIRPDTGRLMGLGAEYICKKLSGKPARFAGDVLLQPQRRRLGLVYNDSTAVGPLADEIRRGLEAQCGESIAEAIGFRSERFDGNDDRESLGTAVARLKNAGVTTVIVGLDFQTMLVLTQFADAQAYSPEWFVTGRALTDNNGQSRLMSQAQWSHAFGISSQEIDAPEGAAATYEQESYRAYKEIDPDNEPSGNIIVNLIPGLEQVMNGIQMAGPRLTPETFEQGLFRMGHRPPQPRWAMAGGYGPDDYTYADAVGEIWWDPTASSKYADQPGAYRWVRDGKRYYPGDFEREDPLVFQEGTSTRPRE